MNQETPTRKTQTIRVTIEEFQQRLAELSCTNRSLDHDDHDLATVSTHSRLALVHQVAKTYAFETTTCFTGAPIELTIDEISNPPVYDYETNDPVVIQFSYYA